jgi:cytosine/adenosine deaminase-related metal-dependent hydrolase
VLGALGAGGDWPTRTSLTHCNHLDDDDLDALAQARVGVCTAPDTECGMRTGDSPYSRSMAISF